MARKEDFNRKVPLPSGLTTTAIQTHTFGLKGAATKLRNAAVYQRKDVKIIGGKAVPANGD